MARCSSLPKYRKYVDERDDAYSRILGITAHFNNEMRRFDPASFSLQSAYVSMFSAVLRRPEGEQDKPTHALVVPFSRTGFERGVLYSIRGGQVTEKQLSIENPPALSSTFGFDTRQDCHVNMPASGVHGADARGWLPADLLEETGRIRNLAYCYTDDILAACFNYGRPVSPYDAQVLKNLAMHSIFFDTIASQLKENEEAFLYTIKALARAAEVNDEDTGNHITRVGEFSYEVARAMGLPDRLAEEIRYSAPMHDVGKIHIPPSILRKNGKLTPEEWEVMKLHPVYGVRILGNSPRLETARQIAMSHHERWDGSGYPLGLKEDEIPVAARVVALCDVYDALRNKRPYKVAFDHEAACSIIIDGDGRCLPSHFDPEALAVFKGMKPRFERIYRELKDPDTA